MSRDDYISKLFIKNQDKLEQAPSADLWSKLEAELDAPAPTAMPTLRPAAWMSYAAAASVLIALLAGGIYWSNGAIAPVQEQFNAPMALNTATAPVANEEAEPYEEPTGGTDDRNINLVTEEREEKEDRAQEQRIVEAVQKRLEEVPMEEVADAEDIEMDDIILADEVVMEEFKLLEPAQNNHASPGRGMADPTVNFYQNDQPVAPQLNYNNSSLPQIANTTSNQAEVEEVLNRSASKSVPADKYGNRRLDYDELGKTEREKEVTADAKSRKRAAKSSDLKKRRGGIVAKDETADKIKSPMADAHPRLYPFGFLLGRWDDDHEMEGRSYEIWTLKDRNTLIGRGYKLSKDAERIFEERLQIVYRDNQVFLVMSFEENSEQIDYMLTSFDQERFVFEQKGRTKYPDKVILQQNGLQGYSVTISNSNEFLTADQQRYLEHRNRVSNVRSIRTLRHTD